MKNVKFATALALLQSEVYAQQPKMHVEVIDDVYTDAKKRIFIEVNHNYLLPETYAQSNRYKQAKYRTGCNQRKIRKSNRW